MNIQVVASVLVAVTSLILSYSATVFLQVDERTLYGVGFVTLSQLLLYAQAGAPGSFSRFGLYSLRGHRWISFLKAVFKRQILMVSVQLVLCFFLGFPFILTFQFVLGYLLILPFQWILNGFQKHIRTDEFAVWRVAPHGLQLIFSGVAFSYGRADLLDSLVLSWIIANLLVLFCALFRTFNIRVIESESADISEVLKVGRKSFVSHIGLQDILKVEYFIIPFLSNSLIPVYFFAIGGLAIWPKVLIDGYAISKFNDYQKLSFSDANIKAKANMFKLIKSLLFFLVLSMPIIWLALHFSLEKKYPEAMPVFLLLSIQSIFVYARRVYLDFIRSEFPQFLGKASHIEIICFIVSSLSLMPIVLALPLHFWTITSAATGILSLVTLIFLTRKF